MRLLEDKNCIIDFLSDVPCIYWKIKGTVGNGEFLKNVHEGVRYFQEHKVEYANLNLIVDLQDFEPTESIDIDYVNEEIMTLLYIRNGIKQIGLVKPKSPLAKEIAHEFFEKTEQLHEIKVHDNFEDAKDWIMDDLQRDKAVGDYTMFD